LEKRNGGVFFGCFAVGIGILRECHVAAPLNISGRCRTCPQLRDSLSDRR
jgi:hypothetical protein